MSWRKTASQIFLASGYFEAQQSSSLIIWSKLHSLSQNETIKQNGYLPITYLKVLKKKKRKNKKKEWSQILMNI